jgi:outer membrane immunogenic protein
VTFSPVLLYVTGGLAIGHFSDSRGQTAAPTTFSSDTMRLGWTLGGGLEYMFAPNWTVKVEGLYADFGATDIVGFLAVTPGLGYRGRFEHTTTVVRAGLNWKW